MAKAKQAKKTARALSKGAKKAGGSALSKVASSAGGLVGLGKNVLSGGSRSSGKRRHRETPEKLMKKILILKLKRKLNKLRYGGH